MGAKPRRGERILAKEAPYVDIIYFGPLKLTIVYQIFNLIKWKEKRSENASCQVESPIVYQKFVKKFDHIHLQAIRIND